jgi:hypothetical protein
MNNSELKEIAKQLSRLNYILEAAFNLKLTAQGYVKEAGK